MYFQINPSGSDYTRVQIDVANDQLGEIIRAITATQAEGESARAARQAFHRRQRRAAQANRAAASRWLSERSAAKVEDERPIFAAVHVEAAPDGHFARRVRDLVEAAAKGRGGAGEGDDHTRGDERLLENAVADVADGRPQAAGRPVAQCAGEAEGNDWGVRTSVGGQTAHAAAAHLAAPRPDAERVLVILLQEGPVRRATILTDEDVTAEQAAAGLARIVPDMGDAELDREGPPAPTSRRWETKRRAAGRDEATVRRPPAVEDDAELDCEGPDAEAVDGGEDR